MNYFSWFRVQTKDNQTVIPNNRFFSFRSFHSLWKYYALGFSNDSCVLQRSRRRLRIAFCMLAMVGGSGLGGYMGIKV